jgi:hypothetical protein
MDAPGLRLFFAASLAINSNALAWCFLKLETSTCPLRVVAGQIQPSSGFPASSHRHSSMDLTRGVIGRTRRAAAVLPWTTKSVPWRPFTQVTASQDSRKHSSGRIPVSANTEAVEARGSEAAARYRFSSSTETTRSLCRSPGNIFICGETSNAPHSTASRKMRLSARRVLFTLDTCILSDCRCAAKSFRC